MRISSRLSAALGAALLLAAGARPLHAQRPVHVAPNAPADRPVSATMVCQLAAMEAAAAPYVDEARATYPAARKRFVAGLPPRHTFFVVTRLRDARGRQEQVFVVADSIGGGRIAGRIWSRIAVVEGYQLGQPIVVPEAELVDWMIARPDGAEEGNVVGRFLDTYRPTSNCPEPSRAG